MADTEKIIDILIAIDVDTIISTYGTNSDSNNPTQVAAANMIYMIVRNDEAVSGNGGNELKVAAQTLDVIRWRETSLSLNAVYSTILYAFEATSGGDLISTPMPLLIEVKDPLPDPKNPLVPTTQKIENYFWNCTVLQPGSVTYHFKFMIMDRDNNVQGYYWWDPYIQITD